MTHPLDPALSVDHSDPFIREAINIIFSTYGDQVSVEQKRKTLFKFGRNRSVGTDQKSTIMILQDTGQPNEVLATSNDITGLISSDTGDANTTFVLEGHTLDTGTGFTFVAQDVVCNGQTAVPLTTYLARANRMYVKKASWPSQARQATGTIYVYDTGATTIVAGVPQTATATKLLLEGDTGTNGVNQTEKCATTLSAIDYWIIYQLGITISRDSAVDPKVDADLEYKELGGVWRPVGLEIDLDGSVSSEFTIELRPPVIIPKNSDVRLRAISDKADTVVTGFISGFLAKVMR